MKRDPLEAFIQTNRTAFDQALPEHNLWSKIEKQLPPEVREEGKTLRISSRKPSRTLQFLKYAAAVVALVSASVFATIQYMNPVEPDGISAEMMTEIIELTDYYNFEVKRKLEQLTSFNPGLDVNKELSSIDDVIADLKLELNEVPKGSEEKIINAMINNFQLKILILEKMLEAKENHFNNSETEEHEISL